ncbi:hypothetical protein [Pectinatus cerevisiiphilus]|uniref:Uncharacterized protein n=1 Tax=Pectinatus cerevisiiphilus TaxID=86956 RepID=A0A4R3K6L0_9FIRM|nr:hypothetical protein [Pectinatus cerevisiiphilus]TCS78398.1 hypothetical protein EDC37_11026 [Pectinatus cerevisiiphilus]
MRMINMLKIFAGIFAVSMSIGLMQPKQASAAYTYTSKDYGYSIDCPQKPLGVIPLIDPNQKGEVLVFKNDGYNILEGWIIATNAFDSSQIPNFDKMTDKESQQYAANFVMNSNGRYQTVLFIPLNGHKVLYAVGQQDVYVDANKKEKADAVKGNVSQRIETYIPGQKTNYVIVFFKSGEMTTQDSTDYQNGLISFKELPADANAIQGTPANANANANAIQGTPANANANATPVAPTDANANAAQAPTDANTNAAQAPADANADAPAENNN